MCYSLNCLYLLVENMVLSSCISLQEITHRRWRTFRSVWSCRRSTWTLTAACWLRLTTSSVWPTAWTSSTARPSRSWTAPSLSLRAGWVSEVRLLQGVFSLDRKQGLRVLTFPLWRPDKLQELLDKAEGPEALPEERKEMEELKALLPEIQEKVEDATEGQKTASTTAEGLLVS